MSDHIPNFNVDINWGEAEFEEEMDSSFLERFGILPSDFDEDLVMTPSPPTQLEEPPKTTNVQSLEFADVSDEAVLTFIQQEDNPNTLKKTHLDIQKFTRFLINKKDENREFHTIPPDELDNYIANFILSAKRTDGGEYEPSTLRNIISSLDRKLKRAKYPYSIMTEKGPAFQLSRDALKAKQRSLKKQGKGNKAQAAKPLTDTEIDLMYERGVLGDTSPAALLNTVWLNNTIHFGVRGTKENYNLRNLFIWGDVQLHLDSTGCEYLELCERQTKTRTGENLCDIRKVAPRMYSNDDNTGRDPVAHYKLYASKRPDGFTSPNDPFYIAPRTVPLSDVNSQWFIKLPIGQRKMGLFMKNMATAAKLDNSKILTNHSARKTLVQKLRNAGVPPASIMQVSGHRNIQSVLNYSDMAEGEQRQCSRILSRSNSSTTTSCTSSDQPLEPESTAIQVYPTQPRVPVSTDPGPANVENLTISNSTQSVISSLFAGATLNIQNFHVHMN